MGTAIKDPVPERVKPSFVIFHIRALWHSALIIRVPRCQKLQMTAEPSLAQDALQLYPYGNSGVRGLSRGTWQRMPLACGSLLTRSWVQCYTQTAFCDSFAVSLNNGSCGTEICAGLPQRKNCLFTRDWWQICILCTVCGGVFYVFKLWAVFIWHLQKICR